MDSLDVYLPSGYARSKEVAPIAKFFHPNEFFSHEFDQKESSDEHKSPQYDAYIESCGEASVKLCEYLKRHAKLQ